MTTTPDAITRAAASRDSALTLRRVERQQREIELLADSPEPLTAADLAARLDVGLRTVERDLARLREAGVPIVTSPGAGGGSRLPRGGRPEPVVLGFEEIAALLASLTALGPTATDSAASAMRALVAAITPEPGS